MGAGSVLFAFDLPGLYHIHGNQDLPAKSQNVTSILPSQVGFVSYFVT
jgi:hypothetical protein